MKVGICGCGFVGKAIQQVLTHQIANRPAWSPVSEISVYDKYIEQYQDFDVLNDTEILFICLPTLYDSDLKSYNTQAIEETLLKLKRYKGLILVKSTILPGYLSGLNRQYPDLILIHNPEFLTDRTAFQDFLNQEHIVLGYTTESQPHIDKVSKFYTDLFPFAELSVCNSDESAMVKLACNSFYACKVQFFTELYLLCQANGKSDYKDVVKMMLKNGWISPNHTTVPGPDGQISYGGACFPKDTNALNQYFEKLNVPHAVLEATIMERDQMRD